RCEREALLACPRQRRRIAPADPAVAGLEAGAGSRRRRRAAVRRARGPILRRCHACGALRVDDGLRACRALNCVRESSHVPLRGTEADRVYVRGCAAVLLPTAVLRIELRSYPRSTRV